MLRIALSMLVGDRAKYAGLLFGITFTSFLVTFSASFLSAFLTRGFALISENPTADVWVMDPTVQSVELTTNMPSFALNQVRSVDGVQSAIPLALGLEQIALRIEDVEEVAEARRVELGGESHGALI